MPVPQGIDTAAIQEAFRRRAGQLPSTAGIQGGAPAVNTPSPGNPLTSAPGLPSSASDAPTAQLAKSQPGEAEIILKALISRLKSLTPSPQPTGGVSA